MWMAISCSLTAEIRNFADIGMSHSVSFLQAFLVFLAVQRLGFVLPCPVGIRPIKPHVHCGVQEENHQTGGQRRRQVTHWFIFTICMKQTVFYWISYPSDVADPHLHMSLQNGAQLSFTFVMWMAGCSLFIAPPIPGLLLLCIKMIPVLLFQ